MNGSELRKNTRFELSLPAAVKAGGTAEIQTATRDVSSSGVCFTMSQECEVGSALEWDLVLPAEICGGETVRIHCRGKVVRVNRTDPHGKLSVAATIEHYEFVRLQ